MSTIDIIIPNYNTKTELIIRCLDSICNQEFSKQSKIRKIIIVDDHSVENNVSKIIHDEKYKDIGVEYIQLPENKGPGNARNVGLLNSRADYVYFVDMDDFLDCENSDSLQILVDTAETFYADCVFGDVLNYDCATDTYILSGDNLPYGICNKFDSFSHQGKLYNRKFLIDNKIFFPDDVYYQEEYPFTILVLLNADMIVHVNTICYKKTSNKESMTYCSEEWLGLVRDLNALVYCVYNTLNLYKKGYIDRLKCRRDIQNIIGSNGINKYNIYHNGLHADTHVILFICYYLRLVYNMCESYNMLYPSDWLELNNIASKLYAIFSNNVDYIMDEKNKKHLIKNMMDYEIRDIVSGYSEISETIKQKPKFLNDSPWNRLDIFETYMY